MYYNLQILYLYTYCILHTAYIQYTYSTVQYSIYIVYIQYSTVQYTYCILHLLNFDKNFLTTTVFVQHQILIALATGLHALGNGAMPFALRIVDTAKLAWPKRLKAGALNALLIRFAVLLPCAGSHCDFVHRRIFDRV